jgi:hypothetical protein
MDADVLQQMAELSATSSDGSPTGTLASPSRSGSGSGSGSGGGPGGGGGAGRARSNPSSRRMTPSSSHHAGMAATAATATAAAADVSSLPLSGLAVSTHAGEAGTVHSPVRTRDYRQHAGHLGLLVGGDLPPEPLRRYWFELHGGYLAWFREERRAVGATVRPPPNPPHPNARTRTPTRTHARTCTASAYAPRGPCPYSVWSRCVCVVGAGSALGISDAGPACGAAGGAGP